MRVILLLCSSFLLLTYVPCVQAQGVIEGTLVGGNGLPVDRAIVRIVTNELSFPRAEIKRFSVSREGEFKVEVQPPGLFRLQFSGLYHDPYEIPIYLAEADTVQVDVIISESVYTKEQDVLGVYLYMYDSGEMNRSIVSINSKDEAGRFLLNIPAGLDSVSYDLKAELGRAHGPVADRFTLGRDGSYEATIYPQNRRDTTIAIDVESLPGESTEPGFSIRNSPFTTRQFAEVYADFERRDRKSRAHLIKLRNDGVASYDRKYDWQRDIRELRRQLKREKDPFKRQVRYLMLLHAEFLDQYLDWEPSKELAQEVIESISPTSPLLSYWPILIQGVIDSASKPDKHFGEPQKDLFELQNSAGPYAEYVHALSHSHPDSSAYRTFLSSAIAWSFRQKQFETFELYYDEYMDAFKGTERAKRLEQQYNPQKRVASGSKVPDFDFVSMDDPAVTYTPEKLLGTNYIISFWATWCGPCITKMEDLHRMHAHYEGDDFEILSVSLNFREEDARVFRADKWPMPWLNTHLNDWEPDKGVLEDFELIGLPKTILVDKKGDIVAVESDEEAFYEAIISHMGR